MDLLALASVCVLVVFWGGYEAGRRAEHATFTRAMRRNS